jgi:hypothetical protein
MEIALAIYLVLISLRFAATSRCACADAKKCRPRRGDGGVSDGAFLMVAVMLGVVAAGLDVVMLGVAGMAVGGVGVVRGLLVIAGLVMLGSFAVMPRGMLMVLGGLVVMVDACVLAHIRVLPGFAVKSPEALRGFADTTLTAARQLCCRSLRGAYGPGLRVSYRVSASVVAGQIIRVAATRQTSVATHTILAP